MSILRTFLAAITTGRRTGWRAAVFILTALLLAACWQAPDPASGAGTAAAPPEIPTRAITPTLLATRSSAVSPSSTSEPDPATTQAQAAAAQICSPLDGLAPADLLDIVSYPYDPPSPGMDDGHHGVDFSYYRRGEQPSIHGLPVRSVLAGAVAAAIVDRPPYGNALIIETPLSLLPEEWLRRLNLPEVQPPLPENPRLTCPPVPLPEWDSTDRSLYLLYAHLDQPPAPAAGDSVDCGTVIGAVGNSGMSGNPHMHLEARIGPSGMSFPELAHYDNAATAEEMGYYCAWRTSGLFQMTDPLKLLRIAN